MHTHISLGNNNVLSCSHIDHSDTFLYHHTEKTNGVNRITLPSLCCCTVPVQGEGVEGVAHIHQCTSGKTEQGAHQTGYTVVLCMSQGRTLHLSNDEVAIQRSRWWQDTHLSRDYDILFDLSLQAFQEQLKVCETSTHESLSQGYQSLYDT